MENINSDIHKLTTFLENKVVTDPEINNDTLQLNINNEFYTNSESVIDDEDTINVLKSCTDPLIKNALILNIKKRQILNEIIKNVEQNLTKINNIQRISSYKTLPDYKLKRIIKKRLGAPYFKDKDCYPSPKNEDHLEMLKHKQLFITDIPHTKIAWSSQVKNKLLEFIFQEIFISKSNEIKVKMKNLLTSSKETSKSSLEKLDELNRLLDIFSDNELIEMLIKEWNSVLVTSENVYFNNKVIESNSDECIAIKIIHNWKLDNIDWEKISSFLRERNSPETCRSMWTWYLHPMYSKTPWNENDDFKLMQIVAEYNHENWDKIAECLNINKSPYQCCVHFHSKIYDKFKRIKWSEDEERLLRNLVDSCRIGGIISWGKIAHHFTNRSKKQIYSHYYLTMFPSNTKGHFSVEEDVLLLATLRLYGNDFKRIKYYFPNRSVRQLTSRHTTLSSDDSRTYTLKDDCKIIEHVEKYGDKNWSLLDINRSNASLRIRCKTLKKHFELNPDDTLEQVPRRSKILLRQKSKIRFSIIAKAVDKLLKLVNKCPDSKDEILDVSYIYKNILKHMPDYEKLIKKTKHNNMIAKKISVARSKNNNPDGSLHHYMSQFFKVSYKNLARKIHMDDNSITETAERVSEILQLLGANLQIPSTQEIEQHKQLDAHEKLILLKLSQKPTKNDTIRPFSQLIPPTPETLVGMRGLSLIIPTLKQHSRGNYEGYSFYVYLENRFQACGIKQILRNRDMFSVTLTPEERVKILEDEQLFYKRLKMIFTWGCIFSDTKIEPQLESVKTTINVEFELPETVHNKNGKGRPKKIKKTYKIELMNKARLEKMAQLKNSKNQEAIASCSSSADPVLNHEANKERLATKIERKLAMNRIMNKVKKSPRKSENESDNQIKRNSSQSIDDISNIPYKKLNFQ